MTGALDRLLVLDLGQGISAPYATKLLAAYGAEVIKIEPPGGDLARREGPFLNDVPHPETSARFLYLNTGKQSLTLDLATAAGRRILLQLAASADAVVENFGPGALDRLGTGWDVLHAANPRLVLTSISYFGEDGPYRDYKATNLTAFAMGGQMSLTGEPDREPLQNACSQAEYQAGLHAFSATLMALLSALMSGVGQRVEISTMEVQAAVLEAAGPGARMQGTDGKRMGNMMRATWGVFPCADGYVGLSAMDRNFPNVAQAIGQPELVEDPRFATALSRQEHNDELEAMIMAWCTEHTAAEIYQVAGETRAPFGYIPTVAELVEWPALRERGFWQEIDHPDAGRLTFPGAPFTLSDAVFHVERPPRLGEHTDSVLRDRLGYTAEDIVRLRQQGVI